MEWNKKPNTILRKQINKKDYHMTLKGFRELIQKGETSDLDLMEFGGCGCMVDYGEDIKQ